MRTRAILLGLFGVGVFILARAAHAQEPDKQRQRAERNPGLREQILERESVGRAGALQAQGIKPPHRPAVKTTANVESFAPVTARFVRFTVLATVSGDEPCLDALDLYGPDGSANLTAGEGARLSASSIWP